MGGVHHRGLAAAVLVATAVAYLPSLGGGWVWDDVLQIADPAPFHAPWRLLSMDVWGALNDAPSDLYRPLALLSHVPGQVLWPGPLSERLVSLALHLLNVGLVAAIGCGLGASKRAAWVAAALFGLHPAASETVAWVSARHDLLATTCVLGGWALLTARRDAAAGALLALAPFCKEPFLLTPLATGILVVGLGRRAHKAIGGSVAGVVVYLGVRAALGLSLPSSGLSPGELVAAMGATGLRFVALLVPTSADAFPLYAGAPIAGVVFLALGLGGVLGSRGRGGLAVVIGAAILVAPGVSASAQNGFLADRYYYVLLAALGAGGAQALASAERRWGGRAIVAALLLSAALGPFTFSRASDWVSNEALYGSSLARTPDNPHAAFHVAHDLHVRAGDCEAAIPLYRLGISADPRAGNNLQACLIEQADWSAAAAIGASLLAADPRSPTPAYNTAWSLAALRRFPEAERLARECLRRDPEHVKAMVLLGRLLVIGGVPEEASQWFRQALAREPNHEEAARRLEELKGEPHGVR
jgi:tetratricopeptide (TPR) repeat protein